MRVSWNVVTDTYGNIKAFVQLIAVSIVQIPDGTAIVATAVQFQ